MINILEEQTSFNCQECNQEIILSLQQIADKATVHCPNCNVSIELADSEAAKTLNDLQKAFDDLENTLKNFGK